MIKKIRIENYKSLKDVEIELSKFNVLIGPNAGGKSNLMDSLAFLSEIAQGEVSGAFNLRGGFERVVFGGKGGKINFSLEFTLEGVLGFYFISFGKDGIEREKLTVGENVVIERMSRDKTKLLRDDDTFIEVSSSWNVSSVHAYGRERMSSSLVLQKFHNYLSSWRLYQPITPEMRETFRARKDFNLERNGENLAQVLLSLYTERPKVFRRIEELLKQGIPQIGELLTPLTEDGRTFIAFREKGFEQLFDYHQISDGTLDLLFYITAVAFPEPKLICFEEPENFIHARLLKLVVEVLKRSEAQIILSTHSPYLINLIEPEDVIVVEKEGNETKVSRIKDPKELKARLADLELGLGEYYYSGALGGIP